MSYADVQQSSLPYDNGHATHANLSRKDDSPPDDPNDNGNGEQKSTKHRRNYQACEPCRERKVKCDLGDVDNPTSGPCAKCAREKKHCWFRPQRKKDSTSKESERPAKRSRIDSMDSNTAGSTLSHSAQNIPNIPNIPPIANFQYGPPPLSPSRSVYSATSPPTPLTAQYHPTSNPYSNRTAPPHFARPQTTSFVAHQNSMSQTYGDNNNSRAQNSEDHVVIPQANSLAESFTSTTDNMSVLVRAATSTEANGNSDGMQQRSRAFTGGSRDGRAPMTSRAQEVRNEAIKVWSQMRFVRAGWFTAEEALEYVEYFYDHLAHMTPVVIHDFRDPATHRTLLAEEPVLALAILAITSRYHTLQSPAAVTRGYYIHEKLWDALRRIVQRLLWGQEQFGGGFCGAGMAPTQESVTGQITWKGSLRTLGTIEACLLLTDWQPRALHFPPGDDENKLVGASFALLDEGPAQTQESGNLPYSTWLEPAWRSDRMSWMLLGLAQSLSFELGVFDIRHTACGGKHEPNSDCLTRRRLRRLVIAYVSQISGRIGIQSSLSPEQDTQDNLGPDSNSSKDKMMKLWFEIASIMFDANVAIFPSRYRTAELVENGEYKKEIAKFVPRLRTWFKNYEAVHKELSPYMQHVLRMEYEYARLYINSLGLQKVVGQMAIQNRKTSTRGPSKELAPVMHNNQHYIDEVRAAAEQILKSSAYGLGNMKALGQAPVRTFLRSLSGMMFVLKLFSLGAEEKVVRAEFKLLRDMTIRMSEQIVDDVHLSPHAARLIQHIMDDVQRKMIRIPKPGSRGQSRQMTPQPHPAQQTHPTNNEYPVFDQESPDLLGTIPMVDISTQTFMPPPNFDPSGTFDATMNGFDTNMDPALYGANDDWISLPIDNLFNLDSSTVSQGYGGIGPTLGDRDMLSLITGTHLDQNSAGAGMSQNFGGGYGNAF